MLKITLLVLALLITGAALPARADLYEFTGSGSDVVLEYTAGSGSSSAILVVDFGDAVGSYAFGYNWSGAATGEDMLNGVAGDGDFSYSSSGSAATFTVNTMSYGGDTFTAAGFDVWSFYDSATGDDGSWTLTGGTAATYTLSDGDWNGYAISNILGNSDEPTTPVPEPATGALVVLGGIIMAARRRFKKA